VAAPPEERIAAVEAALATGAAVLIDGLPAPHAEGAARLAPLLAAATAPVGCAFGLPFQPLFVRARRLLAAGALGHAREGRAWLRVGACRGRLRPGPAAGGGRRVRFRRGGAAGAARGFVRPRRGGRGAREPPLRRPHRRGPREARPRGRARGRHRRLVERARL